MRILAFLLSAILSGILPLPLVGCCLSTETVETIRVRIAEPDESPPPGVWLGGDTGPYPEDVQEVFKPGQKMMLGLILGEQLPEGEITFSGFAFYNKGTGVEEEVPVSPDVLGPWEQGGRIIINYPEIWEVPSEEGEYELRVYVDDDVIAAAPFNVGIRPEGWEPEMEYFPAPIHEVRVFFEGEQAWVYVKGGLPDSCSEFQGAHFNYQDLETDNTIRIEATLKHPVDTICAQVYGYFEKTWAIGGNYVTGETYTVIVNDYVTAFVAPQRD